MTELLIITCTLSFIGLAYSLWSYIKAEQEHQQNVEKTLQTTSVLASFGHRDFVRFDFYKSAEFGI